MFLVGPPGQLPAVQPLVDLVLPRYPAAMVRPVSLIDVVLQGTDRGTGIEDKITASRRRFYYFPTLDVVIDTEYISNISFPPVTV